FFHQFLAELHVVEDLPAQHHEPAIHPRPRFCDMLDARYQAAGLHGDKMEAGPGFYTHKTGDVSAILERFNNCRKRYVREAIGVVSKEHLLSFKLSLDSFQTLANVRGQSCIHKGDVPVMDVATE